MCIYLLVANLYEGGDGNDGHGDVVTLLLYTLEDSLHYYAGTHCTSTCWTHCMTRGLD